MSEHLVLSSKKAIDATFANGKMDNSRSGRSSKIIQELSINESYFENFAQTPSFRPTKQIAISAQIFLRARQCKD